jgi:hypothetical protein
MKAHNEPLATHCVGGIDLKVIYYHFTQVAVLVHVEDLNSRTYTWHRQAWDGIPWLSGHHGHPKICKGLHIMIIQSAPPFRMDLSDSDKYYGSIAYSIIKQHAHMNAAGI